MRVAIAGSSGFIGTALLEAMGAWGYEVVRLVRETSSGSEHDVRWNPARGELAPGALEGCDAVISLSGASIAGGRWTRRRKQSILESRISTTKLLVETMIAMPNPPRLFLCASAIGYYGDCGDRVVDESSSLGDDFAARVCGDWEGAANPARDAGIRVVSLRFGHVMHPSGGILAKLSPVFRLGLGGPLGNGTQWMSWIALHDLIHIVKLFLEDHDGSAVINVVAPNPVTNAEFTREFGKFLRRPTWFRVPETVVRLVFGEMGQTLLLSGQRDRKSVV